MNEDRPIKNTFYIVARGFFGQGKEIVASVRSDGELSIAQCIHAEVDGKMKPMFLSNAIMTKPEGLDTIIEVIEQLRKFVKEKTGKSA